MIETIPDMAQGTLGFRTSGDVTAQDYRAVVGPALRAALDAGDGLRVLIVVGPFHEDSAAVWEALKLDVELGVRHRQAWERTAVVSGVGWVRRATEFCSWMIPGEIRAFPAEELEAAKAWVAA